VAVVVAVAVVDAVVVNVVADVSDHELVGHCAHAAEVAAVVGAVVTAAAAYAAAGSWGGWTSVFPRISQGMGCTGHCGRGRTGCRCSSNRQRRDNVCQG
jgi:hypothetical protein